MIVAPEGRSYENETTNPIKQPMMAMTVDAANITLRREVKSPAIVGGMVKMDSTRMIPTALIATTIANAEMTAIMLLMSATGQ